MLWFVAASCLIVDVSPILLPGGAWQDVHGVYAVLRNTLEMRLRLRARLRIITRVNRRLRV